MATASCEPRFPCGGMFSVTSNYGKKLDEDSLPISSATSPVHGTSKESDVPTDVAAELLQHSKQQKTDDVAVSTEEKKTSLTNADISFGLLCRNCMESAKLWARLHYQALLRQSTTLDADRHALRVLVGTNLVHMAQLECMTSTFYKNVVLPTLLNYITPYRDVELQQYLLECIVQAFSDECHVETLPEFLNMLCTVRSAVDTTAIIASLIARLKTFLLRCSTRETIPADHTSVASDTSPRERPQPTAGIRDAKKQASLSKSPRSGICGPENAFVDSHQENGATRDEEVTGQLSSPSLPGSHNKYLNSTSDDVAVDKRCDVPSSDASGATENSLKDSNTVCVLSTSEERDRRNVNVFVELRSGLMRLIQKAHNEDYGLHPLPVTSTSTTKTKPNRFAQAAAVSRLTAPNVLQLLGEFLLFTLEVFPQRTDLVDSLYILAEPVVLASQEMATQQQDDGASHLTNQPPIGPIIARLMSLPTTRPGHLNQLLQMRGYTSLLQGLSDEHKRLVFRKICVALVESENQRISELACLHQLFNLRATAAADGLLQGDVGENCERKLQREQWLSEQRCVAQLVLLLYAEDTDLEFSLLSVARDHLLASHPDSYPYTFPSLVTKTLTLFTRIQERECQVDAQVGPQYDAAPTSDAHDGPQHTSSSATGTAADDAASLASDAAVDGDRLGQLEHEPVKEVVKEPAAEQLASELFRAVTPPAISSKAVLQLVHSTCTHLMDCNAELGYRVTLQAAEAVATANQKQPGKYGAILSEFIRQGVVCYEELLTDNKSRVKALGLMVALVSSQAAALDSETFESISEKLTRHAAKLLRKSEQCIAVLQCTQLFWNPFDQEKCNISRVQECLERSLKIVLGSLQYSLNDIGLLVQILETYLYHFDRSPNDVPPQAISNLLSLCSEQLAYAVGPNRETVPNHDATLEAQQHFANIILFIRRYQAKGHSLYNDIQLPEMH